MPPKKKKGLAPKKNASRSRSKSKRSTSKRKNNSSKELRPQTDVFADLPFYHPENIRDAFLGLAAASPINFSMKILKKIKVPLLVWHNYEVPANNMKLINPGYSDEGRTTDKLILTLGGDKRAVSTQSLLDQQIPPLSIDTAVLTGVWDDNMRPYVNGGPLMDEYEFSQLHFHWGLSDDVGSEHKVDDQSYPFEMHAVFFNKLYQSHERAKLEEHGIICFVYLFKVQHNDNENLLPITDNLPKVIPAHTDCLMPPVSLMTILKNISADFIVYMGMMKYKCKHGVMWIVSRETFGISQDQLTAFRKLQNKHGNPIQKTYREVQDLKNRTVFLASPVLENMDLVLHPFIDPFIIAHTPSHLKKISHTPGGKARKKSGSKGAKGKGGKKKPGKGGKSKKGGKKK